MVTRAEEELADPRVTGLRLDYNSKNVQIRGDLVAIHQEKAGAKLDQLVLELKKLGFTVRKI